MLDDTETGWMAMGNCRSYNARPMVRTPFLAMLLALPAAAQAPTLAFTGNPIPGGSVTLSLARAGELAEIDGGKSCWCTHVCFIHDSMRHSRRALLYEVPKNFLTREAW